MVDIKQYSFQNLYNSFCTKSTTDTNIELQSSIKNDRDQEPENPWVPHGFYYRHLIPNESKESKLQLLCGFLPARSLDKLYNFADCAGLHLILGLNALHRNPDNSWNTSSTLSLLKYGAGKKYNISWELGNGQYSSIPHAALSVVI